MSIRVRFHASRREFLLLKVKAKSICCMGSSISLNVINFGIDWGWNNDFKDHSPLFRPADVEAVTWKSVAADGSTIERTSESLSSSLENVAKRVELLGYTMDVARLEYAALLNAHG